MLPTPYSSRVLPKFLDTDSFTYVAQTNFS